MATVAATVYAHYEQGDGTFNARIRVYHKREKRYIDTTHYPTSKQLTEDLELKDPFIKEHVDGTMRDYRRAIDNLGKRLAYFTAENLRDYVRDKDKIGTFRRLIRHCQNTKQ